ncbi:MAG: glycosyl hydrolase [Bacteroidota bacterium]|nr:glycosyl hydrolase [Bacteroidota bacterium]
MKYIFIILPLIFSFYGESSDDFSRKKDKVLVDSIIFEVGNWRDIGPFRGGRSTASTGITDDDQVYYMGTTGGGLWKTEDAGISWQNISDGFFNTSSVGAVAVSESDNNIVLVGMGESPVRGVMTSSGDGVYKSVDGGDTWTHLGLENTKHISQVRIHPSDPDIIYVSAQGSPYAGTEDRGIYRTYDGGKNWEKVLYVDANSGAVDLAMDYNNPRILYASFWDHQRLPWYVRSGGEGSGIWKSTDGGDTWKKLNQGLPKSVMGKIGVTVSRANPKLVYAIIESEEGGLYRSDDAGESWRLVNDDRVLRARSWYYMHIYADPSDENVVYVLNAPMMKSIDGGKTFVNIPVPHGDNHYLWINPKDSDIMINSNDGGSNISFNGGKSWSTQKNQPTSQFYRVNVDNRFPYWVYGGQQDNSSVAIKSSSFSNGISWKDWIAGVGGCETAYVAFDKNNPVLMYAGCYQGIITEYSLDLDNTKDIMAYPSMGLGEPSDEQKYRFNWNAPILVSEHDPNTIYHAANKLLKTSDRGISWEEISPDLTKNNKGNLGPGGGPITNEGAGGEVYHTIYYIAESPHNKEVIYTGADDGLIHITKDGGKNWVDITPDIQEGLINSIEVSPHDPATVYIAFNRYKFDDFRPYILKSIDYGNTWSVHNSGIEENSFVRVVREDKVKEGLLYAGTERGIYLSVDGGSNWSKWQRNLPIVPITDLVVHQNDLVVSTQGRGFWIFDDLTPLHEISDNLKSENVHMFDVEDNHKVLYSAMRRQGPLGKNPYYGTEIKYFIRDYDPADSLVMSIEIRDEEGSLVRSFSSSSEYISKKIDLKQGYSSLRWGGDVEGFVPPKGVMTPRGSDGYIQSFNVTPGKYNVTFTYGDYSKSSEFNILPDPRSSVTDNNYNAKGNLLNKIHEDIKSIYESLDRMQDVRSQLNDLNERLQTGYEDIKNLSEETISLVDKVESQLISPKQKTFQDVINFRNQLDAQFLDLLNTVNGNIPPLTEGELERFDDLHLNWLTVKKTYDEVLDNVKSINNLIIENSVPFISKGE